MTASADPAAPPPDPAPRPAAGPAAAPAAQAAAEAGADAPAEAVEGGAAPPGGARLRLRIIFGSDAMLGPGKADLLEAIRETGSISAAGRRLGMSYKRAWTLVEELNTIFKAPLVESTRGGPAGGGAVLTAMGESVLADYRAIEAQLAACSTAEIARLRARLRSPGARG